MTKRVDGADLTAAREALAAGEWARARAAFERSLAGRETTEALEGLATACGMLADGNASIAARERAYALHREAGDPVGAARAAFGLALDALDFRYEAAVAAGWLQRAERWLEGLPPTLERGMVRVLSGHLALMAENDVVTALARAAEGREIARRVGSAELEVLSLGLEGLARVSEGDVREGMRLLDESTVAALGGEVRDPMAIGQSCCYLIHACERVRDFERAGQWCERVRAFCERWHYTTMFTVCRTQYASVLMHRGDWPGAESELNTALAELQANRPAASAPGIARLAELRRRQGRRDEAARLFESVGAHRMAVLGLGELALDRGDAAVALEHAERALRRIPDALRTERVSGLDLLARAASRLGDATRAGDAARELEAIAAAIGTEPLHAFALRARGLAAAGTRDETGHAADARPGADAAASAGARAAAGAARHALEDAADLFERVSMPFEAAETLLSLARHAARAGADSIARAASARAAAIFARLGAERGAIDASYGAGAHAEPSPLTPREREVLRLVADGLADKEIAAKLRLSPHTVHRHVSNILTRLDLPSRAAAVAQAAKLGLLR